MKEWIVGLLICGYGGLFGEGFDPDTYVRRTEAHIKIKDYSSAVHEAKRALAEYPHDSSIQRAFIKALSSDGQEKECITAWDLYSSSFNEAINKNELLEEIAWGVIQNEMKSTTLRVRAASLVAAVLTRDIYAVDILKLGMEDRNSLIRSLSIELAAELRDASLNQEILKLVRNDPVWDVRLQAILVAGEMHLTEMEEHLLGILSDPKAHLEEKAAASLAIVELRSNAERRELFRLIQSPHSELRLLAPRLIAEFDLIDDLDLLLPLLKDSRHEIRTEVLNTFGLLRAKNVRDKEVKLLAAQAAKDPDYRVAITAGWLLALHDPASAIKCFDKWIYDKNPQVRRFASSVVSSTGNYCQPYLEQLLKNHEDSFVRLTAALGLLGQNVSVNDACEEIYNFLMLDQHLIMSSSDENHLFEVIGPSTLSRIEGALKTPEAVDQLIRLQLLRLLAVKGYSKTQLAYKQFLKEKNWGVGALLVKEGDSEAVETVKNLLQEKDQKVKIQAALIIALWSGDEKALDVLQSAYPTADRELKMKILEAVGQVGSKKSLPFLIQAMHEPYAFIRVVAASSIILCLNH